MISEGISEKRYYVKSVCEEAIRYDLLKFPMKGRISLEREDAKEPKSLGIIMKKLFSKQ